MLCVLRFISLQTTALAGVYADFSYETDHLLNRDSLISTCAQTKSCLISTIFHVVSC